jgi:glycogen(starch) synthase
MRLVGRVQLNGGGCKKTLKILFLSTEYPPETGGGGIGSYVASIAPALASRGHEVHVLSCAEDQSHRDYTHEGVHIHRRSLRLILGATKVSRILRLPRLVGHLRSGLSTFLEYRRLGIRFDVIEHPDWSAEGWLFALFHNLPLVAHLHTPLPIILAHNRIPESLDSRLASALEHFSMKESEVITSPSRYLIDKLKKAGWLKDSQIDVLSYPVDIANWIHVAPVSETPPIVLFIGRIERLKAPELLAQAITILRKEIPDTKAIFVGKSKGERAGIPYLDWVKKIAGNGRGCEFIGHVPRHELPRLFSLCRVLALPSWHDNYPMVTLESMAAGRSVVVTQNTGVVELIEITEAGKIVPPGDPNALAHALRPFLVDSRYAERMGKRARDAAIDHLDPLRLAEKREKAYQKATDIFNHRLRSTASGFRHAIPEMVASFQIPQRWRDWAVSEAVKTPWKHFYLPTARQLLELLSHAPSFGHLTNLEGIRILDVGCTPAVSVLLACLGANVTMLDMDPLELWRGRYYADLLGVDHRVTYVCADALRTPLIPSLFHVVWNSGFLEHFDKPKLILNQMGNSLHPGGVLIVLVPNRWTPHSLYIRDHLRAKPGGYDWDNMGRERSFSRLQLTRLLMDAGFKVIASSTSNLRRSVLDDSFALNHLGHMTLRGSLLRLMNFTDWIENHLPLTKKLGFMVGAVAIPLLPTQKGASQS